VGKKPLKKGRASPGNVPAVPPVERTDGDAKAVHERLLKTARKGGIDVYFTGDSIVRRWAGEDYPEHRAHWKKTFRGIRAANFGRGADKLQNVLWRLKNGELDGVNPKVIVLLAGTNDVGDAVKAGSRVRVGDMLKGFRAILGVLRAKAPAAVIILTGIFPRNDDAAMMPPIDRINRKLSKLAGGKKILYLQLNDRLADKKGRLFDGMTQDGVHLTLKGYRAWAERLMPLLNQLLKASGP
jgi:lysophospholipase L1-like esterase